MTTGKHWFTASIVALASVGLFAPSAVLAQHGTGGQHASGSVQGQHGPGRHMPGAEAATYDAKTEATFKGTVEEVNAGRPVKGPARMTPAEQQIVLKTDAGTIDVRLAPRAFLTEKGVEIAKGDAIEVVGSKGTAGESQVVLAREVRKGDTVWSLRDANGQPLWTAAAHDQHK